MQNFKTTILTITNPFLKTPKPPFRAPDTGLCCGSSAVSMGMLIHSRQGSSPLYRKPCFQNATFSLWLIPLHLLFAVIACTAFAYGISRREISKQVMMMLWSFSTDDLNDAEALLDSHWKIRAWTAVLIHSPGLGAVAACHVFVKKTGNFRTDLQLTEAVTAPAGQLCKQFGAARWIPEVTRDHCFNRSTHFSSVA